MSQHRTTLDDLPIARRRPPGSIFLFLTALLLLGAAGWQYNRVNLQSETFPALSPGLHIGQIFNTNKGSSEPEPIVALSNKLGKNAVVIWAKANARVASITQPSQEKLTFRSSKNKKLAALWGNAANSRLAGTIKYFPRGYGKWQLFHRDNLHTVAEPDYTAEFDFEQEFWRKELSALRVAQRSLEKNTRKLGKLKSLSSELETFLARAPKPDGPQNEDKKPQPQTLLPLLNERETLLQSHPRGQIAELERRIAEREFGWILSRWDGAIQPTKKVSYGELDAAELEDEYQQAREIEILETRIKQEISAIHQLEAAHTTQEPAIPQPRREEKKKSFWDNLFG